MKLYKTSKKARIKLGGKTYTRVVYEGYDEATAWWRDYVRLGSMSMGSPNAFCALDTFDEYTMRDEDAYMPGTWATC